MDAVTYMAGLSGGSWATATYIANGGQLPSDMVDNVSFLFLRLSLPFRDLRQVGGKSALSKRDADPIHSYGTSNLTSSSQTMVNLHSTPTSSLKSVPRRMPASKLSS